MSVSRRPEWFIFVLAQDFNSIGDDLSRTILHFMQVQLLLRTMWTERCGPQRSCVGAARGQPTKDAMNLPDLSNVTVGRFAVIRYTEHDCREGSS